MLRFHDRPTSGDDLNVPLAVVALWHRIEAAVVRWLSGVNGPLQVRLDAATSCRIDPPEHLPSSVQVALAALGAGQSGVTGQFEWALPDTVAQGMRIGQEVAGGPAGAWQPSTRGNVVRVRVSDSGDEVVPTQSDLFDRTGFVRAMVVGWAGGPVPLGSHAGATR